MNKYHKIFNRSTRRTGLRRVLRRAYCGLRVLTCGTTLMLYFRDSSHFPRSLLVVTHSKIHSPVMILSGCTRPPDILAQQRII